MQELTFTGLGTDWSIRVDAPFLGAAPRQAILDYVQKFEQRFSRFLPGSEVNAFRQAAPGSYCVSEDLALLLSRADRLRLLTGGGYDPAAAVLLEAAGYGGRGLPAVSAEKVPAWSLEQNVLTIAGPVAFDLGGIGKGYCIDRLAKILQANGYAHFLVDGGGDMYATAKADGRPWRVAIEYPGRPDMAAGMVHLSQRGLAVSDTFRRRFGKRHHLINAREKKNVEDIIGCATIAADAWNADCMTSGIFFSLPHQYPALGQEFAADYLIFRADGQAIISAGWSDELF